MSSSTKILCLLSGLMFASVPADEAFARRPTHHGPDLPPAQCSTDPNGLTPCGPDVCGLEGSAKRATVRALNVLKNRDPAPTDADIDASVTIDQMLAPGDDHGRFDPNKGAQLTGYVIAVQQGGHPETANCGNMTTALTDTHITLATAPTAESRQAVVVEVTPWWRLKMAPTADWRTESLGALIGRKVTIRGWLLFDSEHTDKAETTSPGNPQNWRGSNWEIHPITAIALVDASPEEQALLLRATPERKAQLGKLSKPLYQAPVTDEEVETPPKVAKPVVRRHRHHHARRSVRKPRPKIPQQ